MKLHFPARFISFLLLLSGIIISGFLSCDTTEPSEDKYFSHDITWQADTFGTWQSRIRAVWGSDIENIYAVGTIFNFSKDKNGTNIIHFDGEKWSSENIFLGELRGLFGTSAEDIWAAGNYSIGWPNSSPLLLHKDNLGWKVIKLKDTTSLFDIWGTSPDNYYACGKYGYLIHYDGNSWEKIYLDTDLVLYCIWGTKYNDVYVAGTDFMGLGAIFYYDGSSWLKILENHSPSDQPSSSISSMWSLNSKKYYLYAPQNLFFGFYNKWAQVPNVEILARQEKIFGSNYQNIFSVGHFGTIYHWNGLDWRLSEEFYDPNGAAILRGVWCKDDEVIIVGSTTDVRGLILKGKLKVE